MSTETGEDARSTGLASGCHFTIELVTERWWWNEECYALFGFAPGEVQPTIGLLRSHTVAEDRPKWRLALEHWDHRSGTWAAVLAMLDADRRGFDAMVVGSVVDRPGGMVHGYLVDLSAPVRERAAIEATRQIQEAAASHDTIEQAKGILAAMTGRSVDDSFALLRRTSMDRNIAIRVLARGVVEAAARGELAALGLDSPLLGGDGRPFTTRSRPRQARAQTPPPIGPGARRRGLGYLPA